MAGLAGGFALKIMLAKLRTPKMSASVSTMYTAK